VTVLLVPPQLAVAVMLLLLYVVAVVGLSQTGTAVPPQVMPDSTISPSQVTIGLLIGVPTMPVVVVSANKQLSELPQLPLLAPLVAGQEPPGRIQPGHLVDLLLAKYVQQPPSSGFPLGAFQSQHPISSSTGQEVGVGEQATPLAIRKLLAELVRTGQVPGLVIV